ncbi:hypothetical protein Nepgr_016365 [Nepenthes gracilis]|uniref:Uncharacterized protein n=1 Tax=Nepenthes gracilis TaxID=150966 RepID=A0AAD3SPJ9_NEPGR|nr:hypothetical protein Nepgr_016365 [Nepenthes gracilis]
MALLIQAINSDLACGDALQLVVDDTVLVCGCCMQIHLGSVAAAALCCEIGLCLYTTSNLMLVLLVCPGAPNAGRLKLLMHPVPCSSMLMQAPPLDAGAICWCKLAQLQMCLHTAGSDSILLLLVCWTDAPGYCYLFLPVCRPGAAVQFSEMLLGCELGCRSRVDDAEFLHFDALCCWH